MATGTRVRRRGLLRRRLGRRCEMTLLDAIGPIWPDEPDDGSAGVREPRRPKPDLPSLAAEAS